MMDPSVWITGIVAAAVVLLIALKLGRRLRFTKSNDKTSLEINGGASEKTSSDGSVKVAEGMKMTDVEVGNVTGISGANPDSDEDVELLKGASVTRGKIGDIVGKTVKDPSNEDN